LCERYFHSVGGAARAWIDRCWMHVDDNWYGMFVEDDAISAANETDIVSLAQGACRIAVEEAFLDHFGSLLESRRAASSSSARTSNVSPDVVRARRKFNSMSVK
jgi:hypothetical protein